MANTLGSPMTINTFLKVAQVLPCDTSILLRADHGVGKSVIGKTLNKLLNKRDGIERHYIDQRLSQKSEADMIGLPDRHESERGNNVTRFLPPEWVELACNEPCFINLDEFNRATPEVMQAGFELVLDRCLNGNKLHPQTIVIACVNTGFNYAVNDMDPALLDRFFVVDLDPSLKDWLHWASTDDVIYRNNPDISNIDPMVFEFIRQEGVAMLDTPSEIEPGEHSQSRRSWERFSTAGRAVKLFQNVNLDIMYPMAQGYLGTIVAARFKDFAQSWDRKLTGEELVTELDKASVKSALTKILNEGKQSERLSLIEKVCTYIRDELEDKTYRSTSPILKNLYDFGKCLPPEDMMKYWSLVVESANAAEKMKLVMCVSKKLKPLFQNALEENVASAEGESA